MAVPSSERSGRGFPETTVRREKNERILALLRIIRFPNLFTAMADVAAGYLIVAGTEIRGSILMFLLLSTSALYAGGCVLNDLRDVEEDARERPFRPLPAGIISKGEAVLLCIGLFTLGLSFASVAGKVSFMGAFLLFLLILSYDFKTKDRNILGPLNMGGCRSVNLLLGMTPAIAGAGVSLVFPVTTLAYVFLLTRLSRFETTENPRGSLGGIFPHWILLMVLLILLVVAGGLATACLFYLALLLALAFPALLKAVRHPQPKRVGTAVKMLILGLPLLDAFYASATQGWAFGIPVALFLLPPLFLSRRIYMT